MPREHDDDLQGSFFSFELDGLKMAYFTACSGISIEFDPIKFKQIGQDGKSTVEIKRPGRPKYSQVVMKRGFTADNKLYEWFDETVKGAKKTQYKSGSIVVYSREQKEVAWFNLTNCWPSKLTVSDMTTKSDDVMIEEVTIEHEMIEWA